MQLNQTRRIDLEEGDALLIIDLQNDFLAGGSLAVPGGDSLIPVVNAYISKFQQHRLPIYLTRDWHPPEHGSFVGQGGQWPEHCIAGSNGAEFPSTLTVPETARIVSKGIAADEEGYSAFSAPGFHRQLQEDGVRRLFCCGLATDYCVLHSVRDALQHHYQVYLLQDAIAAVNIHVDAGKRAIQDMIASGAIPLEREMIA